TSYAAVPTHADPSFPTRRSSDLMGRYHGLNSEVEVVNLQPTLSYKINDQVSVGGGLVISRIYGKLTSNSAVGPFDAKIEIEGDRSEEHTSELQSRENLVCRLLLE